MFFLKIIKARTIDSLFNLDLLTCHDTEVTGLLKSSSSCCILTLSCLKTFLYFIFTLTSTALVLLAIYALSLCNFCFLKSLPPPLVLFASVLFRLGACMPGTFVPPLHTWLLLCFLHPFTHTVFISLQPDGSPSFII